MPPPARALELARLASGLAAGAGVSLPAGLQLWALAGGQPVAAATASADPARALGEALEQSLTTGERRAGAHYTPRPVAAQVAALALEGSPDAPVVVDPACGAGALLLAAADHLAAAGRPRGQIAAELLWGADVDPLAAAVTEAAIALWSGGVAPAPGHVCVGDTLLLGSSIWGDPPAEGFDVVVGNPPFQGQLARATARSPQQASALRARFGDGVSAYVDTAALFLLAGVDLVRAGGQVALVQPQSTVAARDAGGVRAALAERAELIALWAPSEQLFGASVHVCVPVLAVGRSGDATSWQRHLAAARGIPVVSLGGGPTVTAVATVTAGFRDEYYGLVPHVREAGPRSTAPLVTSGLIGIGTSAWGERPVRFAKRRWARPEVDVEAVRASAPRVGAWLERVRQPKVVVASQTRVLEAAADVTGSWVPATPAVSVLPHEPGAVERLAALLCAPPVSAWVAARAVGTGLAPDALRTSASLVATIPLPDDAARWEAAARQLASGDLPAYARTATAMFALPPEEATAVVAWWTARARNHLAC